MEEKSPERKYAEVTSNIKILSSRATKAEVSKRLKDLAIYLEEVRKQRHLCMLSEKDRIENVRFREILEYINSQYDGTENSVGEICKMLNKREDIEEVLKYLRINEENKKEDVER